MSYYLSKQRYWHDEQRRTCIELCNDLDAISPGCLAGSIEEFETANECADKAIQLQEQDPDLLIVTSNTLCYGDPDDPMTVEEVDEWVKRNTLEIDEGVIEAWKFDYDTEA